MPRQIVFRCSLLLASLFLFADYARANSRCVNPGGMDGCYATIQAAVDASIDFDTIQIAPGTYNERVSMQPPNNKFITIQGSGAERTIVDGTGVGAPNAPVFQLSTLAGTGPSVTLMDMTIRGGYRGVDTGRGTRVTLRNLVVRDNGPGSGAGVFANSNFVTIINSVIRDNVADDAFFGCDGSGGAGGGIAALCGGAFYTVIDSAIINNRARVGGAAMFVNGYQTILNSTISGNEATDPNGIGGAILNFADRFYLTNSTVANNRIRPGGGALATFSAYNEIKGSILLNPEGGNCLPNVEPLTSVGYNVVSDDTCNLSGPGDLQNTPANLGPLQNNGGTTPTHALLPGPGVDLLPVTICPAPAADQRGVPRAQGSACDAGAYEAKVQEQIDALQGLARSIDHSLSGYMTVVEVALKLGRPAFACSGLAHLQEQVDRRAGKHKITPEEAAALNAAIASVRGSIGCS